jgi:YhcH/YjgK/YiaL family protein
VEQWRIENGEWKLGGPEMILDALERAERYANMHPLFQRAFDYLRKCDPATVQAGTYELDGRNLYVIISRSAGQPAAPALLEAHRKYIDLQVTLQGDFSIGWRALADCTLVHMPYDAEKDAMLFDDPAESRVILSTGRFAIFFPEDAHAPEQSPNALTKAVFKVALS